MEEAVVEASLTLQNIASRGMNIYPTTENTTMDLIDLCLETFDDTIFLASSNFKRESGDR